MTITYKTTELGIQVPVLHKVVYDRSDTIDLLSQYYYSYKDHLVNEWLKQNCCHPYYHGPGYLREKSIQFECSDEALLFALRWS